VEKRARWASSSSYGSNLVDSIQRSSEASERSSKTVDAPRDTRATRSPSALPRELSSELPGELLNELPLYAAARASLRLPSELPLYAGVARARQASCRASFRLKLTLPVSFIKASGRS
jgi:hypothetical protein